MMFQFSENLLKEMQADTSIGFYPLAQKLRDKYGENIVLAQYLLAIGMVEYSRQFEISLDRVKDLLFSLGVNPQFKPAMPAVEDVVVKPCGGCGGGKVR